MLSMNDLMDDLIDESPSKNEENKRKPSIVSVQPIEETQTVNEDELIDQNGEFKILADNQLSNSEPIISNIMAI